MDCKNQQATFSQFYVYIIIESNKFQDGGDEFSLTGLGKGGSQLLSLKLNYQKAIKGLINLASLQTSFITLGKVNFHI